MKKIIKIISVSFVSLILVLILAFFIFLYNINTKSINIPLVDSVIAYYFESIFPDFNIISKQNVFFLNKNDQIEIDIHDFNVSGKDGNKAIHADLLKIHLNPRAVFKQDRIINHIIIKNPVIFYDVQSTDNRIESIAMHQGVSVSKILKSLNKLPNISISNAEFILQSNKESSKFKLQYFNSIWQKKRYIVSTLTSANHSANFILSSSNGIDINASFTSISLLTILNTLNSRAPTLKKIKEYYDVSAINVNGNAEAHFNFRGNLINGSLKMDSNNSLVKLKSINQSRLSLKKFSTLLHFKPNYLLIKSFKLSTDNNILFKATGQVKTKYNLNTDSNISKLLIKYDIKNINISDINKVWPGNMAGSVKEWITNNIKSGNITNIKGKFDLNENYFMNNIIDAEAIKANINLKNAIINYWEGLPIARSVDAKIELDTKKINAYINTAKIKQSDIKNTRIILPYELDYIKITGNVAGPVADFYYFFSDQVRYNFAQYKINLHHINEQALTQLDLTIPIANYRNYRDIDLKLNSKIDNFSLQSGLNAQNTDLNVCLSQDSFVVSGVSQISGINIDFLYNKNLAINKNIPLVVSGKITNHYLTKWGIDHYFVIDTKTYLPITVSIFNDHVNVKSNLSDLSISIPSLSFTKPKQKKAFFMMDVKLSNGVNYVFDNLMIKGEDIDIKGYGNFGNINQPKLNECNLNIVKLGRNSKIDINYNNIDNKKHIVLKAISLDLSKTNFIDTIVNKKMSSNNSQAINLIANRIYLRNNNELHSFRLHYDCADDILTCHNLTVDAKFDDNSTLNVRHNNSNNSIMINASNGGKLLNSLGVYQDVKQGDIKIDINQNMINDDIHGYKGKITYNNFKFTKQSLIVKLLLSITSLPHAIIFAANDNNIKNNNFQGDIILHKNILNLVGRIKNRSYEISLKGNINFLNDKIKIKGSVIPLFYGINRAIGSIPIIGTILGGSTGAVVAANYTIDGKIADSAFVVNPLSILPIVIFKEIFK